MVEQQSHGDSSQEAGHSDLEILALDSIGAQSADDSAPGSGSSRAEEALDDLLQRTRGCAQWLSLQGLIWYSRAREELEDIVAEAQQMRRGKVAPNPSTFFAAGMFARGREELARIVTEAQQVRAGTRSPARDPGYDGDLLVKAVPGTRSTADQIVGIVPGIGSVFSKRLEEGGIRTVQDLAAAQPAELAYLLGTGEERAQGFIEEARKLVDQQPD